MEANETTRLVSPFSKPSRVEEDLEAAYIIRSRSSTNNSFTEFGFANKALILVTATLAIVLFVIIIDMSITALQIAVPAFKKPN